LSYANPLQQHALPSKAEALAVFLLKSSLLVTNLSDCDPKMMVCLQHYIPDLPFIGLKVIFFEVLVRGHRCVTLISTHSHSPLIFFLSWLISMLC
jgi:hypothetical protein